MDRTTCFYLLFSLISISKGLQPGNWKSCQDGKPVSTRTDTSKQLADLRRKMADVRIAAYIVPSEDFHLSEFVSAYDARRKYISGFDGSLGTAVITANRAALWTRGKYFLQAENQLGCDWILMREREPGVPTIQDWLGAELLNTSIKNVGACPYFFGNSDWLDYQSSLEQQGLSLTSQTTDLIDQIWTEGRQEFPSTIINQYPLKYAGKSWQDKVTMVREEMKKQNVDALVVTMLDEIAWLFNMRATDIRGFVNDPFFYGLAIVQLDSIRLYIKDKDKKLDARPTELASTMTVKEHLNTRIDGTCDRNVPDMCVEVKEYVISGFMRDLDSVARNQTVKRVWVSYFCNFGIYSLIPQGKLYIQNTPVAMLKTLKNDVEVEGMQQSHIRDGAALAIFASKLERGIENGEMWTEISASEELSRIRSLQTFNRGDSFTAISSSGPNAAIIHYSPTNMTDRKISKDETYLIDSGGQYLDGTTDVTRTFFWGNPPAFIKECYTRILMGQINLAKAVWTKGLFGREIDAWAREPLFSVGLTYKHGTGHGIGHYLSVHEGPGRISNYHAKFVWDVPLDEHMFYSDEPGFYRDGEFGIRLENVIYVKEVKTKYSMEGVTMLGMETVTLFPYEPHLIDHSIMSNEQIEWLNNYNERVLDKVGYLLKIRGEEYAYNWVEKRTRPIHISSGSQRLHTTLSVFFLTSFLVWSF